MLPAAGQGALALQCRRGDRQHPGNSLPTRRPPLSCRRRSRAGRRRGPELRLPFPHRGAGANRKPDVASARRPRQARRRSARSSREFNCTARKCRRRHRGCRQTTLTSPTFPAGAQHLRKSESQSPRTFRSSNQSPRIGLCDRAENVRRSCRTNRCLCVSFSALDARIYLGCTARMNSAVVISALP